MPVCSVTFRDYPMSKGDQAPNGASPPAKMDDCRTRQNFLKKNSMSFNSFKWDIVHHAVVFKNWPMISKQSLQWRHNDHDGVSNRQPHGCLLNRLFRRRSKKTSKLRVTGLCVGNSPGPVNSPHKGPVRRKMFPFDDVIMSRGTSSTHLPLVPHICVAELGHHWFR